MGSKGKIKRRALARLPLRPDAAAVALNDALDDRQARIDGRMFDLEQADRLGALLDEGAVPLLA